MNISLLTSVYEHPAHSGPLHRPGGEVDTSFTGPSQQRDDGLLDISWQAMDCGTAACQLLDRLGWANEWACGDCGVNEEGSASLWTKRVTLKCRGCDHMICPDYKHCRIRRRRRDGSPVHEYWLNYDERWDKMQWSLFLDDSGQCQSAKISYFGQMQQFEKVVKWHEKLPRPAPTPALTAPKKGRGDSRHDEERPRVPYHGYNWEPVSYGLFRMFNEWATKWKCGDCGTMNNKDFKDDVGSRYKCIGNVESNGKQDKCLHVICPKPHHCSIQRVDGQIPKHKEDGFLNTNEEWAKIEWKALKDTNGKEYLAKSFNPELPGTTSLIRFKNGRPQLESKRSQKAQRAVAQVHSALSYCALNFKKIKIEVLKLQSQSRRN